MLNGTDPVIIFHLYKAEALAGDETISLAATAKNLITLPAIPIYLSEEITGLYVESEDRDITVQTATESTQAGEENQVDQKASGSMLNVELTAKRNAIGLSLFLALADLILPKVTSKEYAITYLNGSTTIFLGLFEGLTTTETKNDDLVKIQLKLSKANAKKKPTVTVPEPTPVPEAVTLDAGSGPMGGTTPPLKGPPAGSQPPISLNPG